MQSKLYRLVLACYLFSIIFLSHTASAQCGSRYLDTTFTAVDSFPDIVYTTTAGGSNTTELMNIYQPHGDSACLRHLAIFVHGGAFVMGTKDDGDMQLLCHRFAQRGYVCATINYRLASNILLLYDSNQIFKYSYEAMSDLKAAIRYFYKDAQATNQWNIDTSAIFVGGSSAGGIAADFAATLDSVSEITPAFQSIATSNGGIDGNSGNAGYSTRVAAVASLAGAVNDLRWIKATTPPIVFCQGTADGTIPYECGLALTQYFMGYYHTINFCGSGQMAPRLDSVGVRNSLLPFPGSGHVPWDTNVVIANRMDSAVAAFFYSVNCTQAPGHCTEPVAATGIATIVTTPQISIYPNPAHDIIQVSIEDMNELATITLYDYTGRIVAQKEATGKSATLSTKTLSAGIYTIQIGMQDMTRMSRAIAIE